VTGVLRPRTVAAALLVALVSAGACSGAGDTADGSSAPTTTAPTTTAPTTAWPGAGEPTCTGTGVADRRVESYLQVPDAPADLTTLEVIRPALDPGCGPTPVLIWVHGGGWSVGDRRRGLADKVELATSLGWTFVSVNYRLSPAVQYPVHNDDVAAAIDWVADHADELGLDAARMTVMGHSAGAGILAGVLADPDHLGRVGRDPGDLRCAVLLDTEGYDVEAQAGSGNRLYLQAFGDDPDVWAAASPIEQLRAAPGTGPLPDTLVVTRGAPARRATAEAFVAALRTSGARAELLDARPLSHEQVNDAVGAADDAVVTAPLVDFLARC
jgi:acetyl esterase/lipase